MWRKGFIQRIVFSLFALMCLLGASCSDSRLSQDTIRIGANAEPKALDPHIVTGLVEYNILQALFEGLVNLHPETLEPIPGVAERWEISPDGKTYTFHLNPKAHWSNGDPITAQDFIFSWERILSPKLAAEYAFLLYCIRNAEAYNQGRLEDFSQVGITAIDAHTLQVELTAPTPYFLSLQVHFAYYPVHEATLRAHGDIYAHDSRWTRPQNMVSNGAYQLEDWRLGQFVSVSANPYWHNAHAVRTPRLRFYPIKDQNTETRAFLAEQIHVTAGVPYTRIADFIKNNDPRLRIDPDLGIYYFLINTTHPVLNDPRVRRALSLAIDRQQIADAIRQRGESPAYTLVPPGTANYETGEALLHENRDKARALLTEAGYPNGQGFPKLELLYNTSEQHRQIAVAIQAMWKDALGIDIRLTNQTWKVYLDTRNQKNYAIARAGWFADYNDPMTFLEIWRSNSGINHSGWANEAFDALLAEASRETDIEKRASILRKAESLLMDESPLIPVFFYKRAYLISPELKGWSSNIMNIRAYENLYLEVPKKP